MTTTQEQLEQANEILTQIRIKEAIPATFEYNPAYTPENRELLTKHSIEKELSRLGAKIVVSGGEAKLVRTDNPEMDLYDQAQNKVTLQSVVLKAIAPLSVHGLQAEGTEKKDKKEVVQLGHTTYYFNDPAKEYHRPRNIQEHLAQLDAELGIRP